MSEHEVKWSLSISPCIDHQLTPSTASFQDRQSPAPSQCLISQQMLLYSTVYIPKMASSPMNWASASVAPPFWSTASTSTTTKYSSKLPRSLPASASPIWLDYSSGVHLVITTGPGNPPVVQGWTANTGRFGSSAVEKPDPLTLGGPNLDLYPLTCGFCPGWAWCGSSNMRFCISVFTYMVAFRYTNVNRKILTLVHHGVVSTYWPSWFAKWAYSRPLPHHEIERQLSVNNFWSCIFGNISGAWSQVSIQKDMAALIGRYVQDIPTTLSGTVTTYFIYRATTKYSWAF